jgi:hypothetical protein
MDTIHNLLINIDVSFMISLLVLLLTGYLLYKILSSPIKSMKIIVAGLFFLLLGSAAWLGMICLLIYM